VRIQREAQPEPSRPPAEPEPQQPPPPKEDDN
jgi:hypothetical protein